MDVFIFYCPYCGKFSEKQVCSHCRNALYTRTGLFVKNNTGHSYFPRELKEKMTAKLLDELKKRAEKSKTKALAFVEKESETTKKSDAKYDAKAIIANAELAGFKNIRTGNTTAFCPGLGTKVETITLTLTK